MSFDYNKWIDGVHNKLTPPGYECYYMEHPSEENKCLAVGLVFEHRFAFFHWAEYAKDRKGHAPVLITIDSHNDVGAHSDFDEEELSKLDLRNSTSLGLYSWLRLSSLNDGQISPSLYLNFFSDVHVLLKDEENDDESFKIEDLNGNMHGIHYHSSEDSLIGITGRFDRIYLDVDLDYFSDQNTGVQWEEENIVSFLKDSDRLIQSIFTKAEGLSMALEPKCCGGLANSLNALQIINRELFDNNLGK